MIIIFRVPSIKPNVHRLAYQHALAFTVFESDTVHLLTRHHRPIPPEGYLYPITDSTWLSFLMPVLILMAILYWSNKVFAGTPDNTDIAPLFFMFHYDDNSC